MFLKIFLFEIGYWLRRWQFYVYFGITFLIAYLLILSSGGFFDSNTVTTARNVYLNSPSAIMGLTSGLSTIIYFFLPAIFGTAIHKDFATRSHTLLYSYPFSKLSYFTAKYLSAAVIMTWVLMALALGFFLGYVTPGVNPDFIGPHSIAPYLKVYGVYIIPNVLVFGAVAFVLVSVTRNMTIGYIFIIILLFQDALAQQFFDKLDDKSWGAIFDPFGMRAHMYYTEYWTIDEQNNSPIPLEKYVWLNRAFWVAFAAALLSVFYRYFRLSQNPVSLFKRKVPAVAKQARRYGLPQAITLPAIKTSSTLLDKLSQIWRFSNMHFTYIVKSTAFIIFTLLGLLFLGIALAFSGEIYETKVFPLTWQMLDFGTVMFLFIIIATLLYAGFLLHREKAAKMHQLVDVTPSNNAIHLWAKFLAIVKMQIVLLLLIAIAGSLYQMYRGFGDIKVGVYLYQLLGLQLWSFVPWAAFAFVIHLLIPNKYVGFIIGLGLYIGFPFLSRLGIEQSIYIFNQGQGSARWSDLDGFGTRLGPFVLYRTYWLLFSLVLLSLAWLLWRRGFVFRIKERLRLMRRRINPRWLAGIGLSMVAFLGMGFYIWRENNVKSEFISSKESELLSVKWEKTYKRYEQTPQPRITDVEADVDLYPNKKGFQARGTYLLVNKNDVPVDTVVVNYNNNIFSFDFSRAVDTLLRDQDLNIALFKLRQPLAPGDSMQLRFTSRNQPNTATRNRSGVLSNGIFLNNSRMFPSFGYNAQGELRDDKVRKKYDLPPKDIMPPPSDTLARGNTYIANDADWVNFETTVSTVPGQIAVAPGYLQREWIEEGRRYFHYKMDAPILNFFNYVSGEYAVVRDTHRNISLEIYHHPSHDYNTERMMRALHAGLDYYEENFSPYQFRQVRILEFPRVLGSFAQSFANTIPFSEAIGFIAEVDDSEEGGLDYPFSVTAHELAHQWWAHQVIGSNTQGATMMSESLSEYSSLKVVEQEYGKDKMRIFLKDALDRYLQGRTFEQKRENPLMYNENQAYIHYNKGSLVFYALSDYIGEDKLNSVLSAYIDSVAFQEPPYTTSEELVDMIREVVPDSLQYLIRDMFETITLYDNRIVEASTEAISDDKHKVRISYQVLKYRSDEKGKRSYADEGQEQQIGINAKGDTIQSVPLSDYIDIGVFGEDDKVLYFQKHHIKDIFGELEITVSEKPVEVGVDPYFKLIDTRSNDNRRKL